MRAELIQRASSFPAGGEQSVGDDTAGHLAHDRLLASRILAGDDDAFAEVVHAHRRRVVRIAGRFFRRTDVIEDIAQEVFVKAFSAMAGYKGEVPLAHWLSRITVNACYDQLRRQRTRPEISFSRLDPDPRERSGAGAPGEGHDASVHWQREEARLDAERLLAKLPPADRVVLTLMVLEGLTVAEVGQLTGWSAANVKIRAFRARNRLRALIAEGGKGTR
ncbi:MAG: RNA polymerase sigma factor [Acidobacteriia bacterium]|nr:RNA polymerase sigma factor [Terriglobia bacterium]